jgi:hypothetical protein
MDPSAPLRLDATRSCRSPVREVVPPVWRDAPGATSSRAFRRRPRSCGHAHRQQADRRGGRVHIDDYELRCTFQADD